MNAPLDIRMDNKAFLQWVQGRAGRFELEKGRVVQQMTGGSRNHALLIGRLTAAFAARLDPGLWAVLPTDLGVEIADSVRFPDVMIERAGMDGQALSSSEPVVLIEVLSPSSVLRDLKTKLVEYTALPSLESYIVVSQDEPIVWLWQRSQGNVRAFPVEPLEINGRNETMTIAYLDATIPLAVLYRGIGH